MNIRLVTLIVSTLFLMFSVAARADVVVGTLSFADGDVCDHVAGLWQGGSDVSIAGLPCHYDGKANITPLSDPHMYSLDVDLTGGNHFWCPNTSIVLPGSCEKGSITIHTNNASLSGELNSAGTHASLHGEVYYSVFTIKVKSIEVNKVN